MPATAPRVLYLEPFHGGSHAAFGRTLQATVEADWMSLTLPARHWKWRMRGSAAFLAGPVHEALARPVDLVFASSYLPLAELYGLVPALAGVPSILYFHENQLAFPVRDEHTGERDTHFGFTQLVSALAATRCVFNSAYNRDSFFAEGRRLLARLPDAVPPDWIDQIADKSEVLGLPLDLPRLAEPIVDAPARARARGPLIVWNHRWEHDKDPETFFGALFELRERDVPFRVAVCGQRFRRQPSIFESAQTRLADRIETWGPLERPAYEALLARAQIAVSTARHEFFGVAMLEATHFGAHPLVPDRLAYPELFPAEHRYADGTLAERLEALCRAWTGGELDLRASRTTITAPHGLDRVGPRYAMLLASVSETYNSGS